MSSSLPPAPDYVTRGWPDENRRKRSPGTRLDHSTRRFPAASHIIAGGNTHTFHDKRTLLVALLLGFKTAHTNARRRRSLRPLAMPQRVDLCGGSRHTGIGRGLPYGTRPANKAAVIGTGTVRTRRHYSSKPSIHPIPSSSSFGRSGLPVAGSQPLIP